MIAERSETAQVLEPCPHGDFPHPKSKRALAQHMRKHQALNARNGTTATTRVSKRSTLTGTPSTRKSTKSTKTTTARRRTARRVVRHALPVGTARRFSSFNYLTGALSIALSNDGELSVTSNGKRILTTPITLE